VAARSSASPAHHPRHRRIKAYSWFHPTYLLAAIVVLGLGWLMNRTASPTVRSSGLELRDTQLHG
jgi:hypothetical protein